MSYQYWYVENAVKNQFNLVPVVNGQPSSAAGAAAIANSLPEQSGWVALDKVSYPRPVKNMVDNPGFEYCFD